MARESDSPPQQQSPVVASSRYRSHSPSTSHSSPNFALSPLSLPSPLVQHRIGSLFDRRNVRRARLQELRARLLAARFGTSPHGDGESDDSDDDVDAGSGGDDDDEDIISILWNEVIGWAERSSGPLRWPSSPPPIGGEEVLAESTRKSRRPALTLDMTRIVNDGDDYSSEDEGIADVTARRELRDSWLSTSSTSSTTSWLRGTGHRLGSAGNSSTSPASLTFPWVRSPSSPLGDETNSLGGASSRKSSGGSDDGDGDGDSSNDEQMAESSNRNGDSHWHSISSTSSSGSESWAWDLQDLDSVENMILASWMRDVMGYNSPTSPISPNLSRMRSVSSSLDDESGSLNGASDRESRGGDDDGYDADFDDSWLAVSMAHGERPRPRRFSDSSFTSTGTWIAEHCGRIHDGTSSQNSSIMGSVTDEGQNRFVGEPHSLNGESFEGDSYLEEDFDSDEGVQVEDDGCEDCDSVG
jgi:hypothetical protein